MTAVQLLRVSSKSSENSPGLTPNDIMVSILNTVCTVWSSPVWLKSAAPGNINTVRLLLCTLLCEEVDTKVLNAHHGIISSILKGVQYRLESSLPDVRIDGMFVANKLSIILDPSNPLMFDELEEVHEDTEEEQEEVEDKEACAFTPDDDFNCSLKENVAAKMNMRTGER